MTAGPFRATVQASVCRASRAALLFVLPCLLALSTAGPSLARSAARAGVAVEPVVPTSLRYSVLSLAQVARHDAPVLDREAILAEDDQREEEGLPPRYAIPTPTKVVPSSGGTWEDLPGGLRLWRLHVASPGAVSLNFGFNRYHMPPGGQLLVYDVAHKESPRRFTAADNEDHGELWTPVVMSDDVVLEVTIPAKEQSSLVLELTSVNVGYRGFAEMLAKAGSCNIDVVCPQGDDWREEIQSVGVISTGGSTFCTGFMVNNTAQDQTPYFMTANHCGISTSNAPSLVVYWNFQSPECGDLGGGSLDDYQTGSYFRASYATSDFTLVELDDDPDPAWNISYAGWDHGSQDPTSAVAIHHPSTDEKCISFEYDPCTTTSYLGESVPGNGSHIRITDWDVGTTEPGSSGSPLFDQNHHVVGQLHGGYAACGNDLSDWYGRFSMSWTGDGTSSTRLQNWLDPLGTGQTSLNTLAPWAGGLRVTPSTDFVSEGDMGGPFSPSSVVYTLENIDENALEYAVLKSEAWLSLSSAGGHLEPGEQVAVTVSINANAQALPQGTYTDVVSFQNLTNGDGDTGRLVSLRVGVPVAVYSFPMDSNPGWSAEGSWAFGQPTGSGGEYGGPDPSSGHTGPYVCGYNLNGDYENNMPEQYLTTPALDCSDLSAVTLRFQRWLGVERSQYDHASVRVSNDGTDWSTVWENGDEVTDSSWQLVEYDLSEVADHQPTVYIRWVMGTTDYSWRYCGWNIDDVEIWAIEDPGLSDVPGSAVVARTQLEPNVPNPFNPLTVIPFELARPAHVQLAVYDVRGRLVRSLMDDLLGAGAHRLVWDGKDDTGQPVGSGTYLYRLRANGTTQERKMLLVR